MLRRAISSWRPHGPDNAAVFDDVRTSKVPRCDEHTSRKEKHMGAILLVILILLLIGVLPAWPYSSGWGYWPSGGLGLIVLILLVLALTGNL